MKIKLTSKMDNFYNISMTPLVFVNRNNFLSGYSIEELEKLYGGQEL